jgi:subtilisin-like proprotein convertase family protein
LAAAALVSSAAMAAPVSVTIANPDGSAVTGPIAITGPDGRLVKKLVDVNGTYTADLEIGSKYLFSVNESTKVDAVAVQNLMALQLANPNAPQGVPANDDCSAAIPVAVPSSTDGTTLGSTLDAAPDCGATITTGGVWYSLVGTGGQIVASTCNTADYDTKINVYCLGCAAPTCVDGNDDGAGCAGFTSEVSFASEAGSEYLILVHGFSSSQGNFTLNITDGGANQGAPVVCTPPPPSGACCNCLAAPGNCSIETEDACLAKTNDPLAFQGEDTVCFVLGAEVLTSSTTTPVAIPDNFSGTATDTINVATSTVIGEAKLFVDVRHSWVGDLIMSVEHGGVSVLLWNGNCDGGQFIDFIGNFDDDGTSTLCGSPTPGDGNGIPPALVNGDGSMLSDFDGLDCAGDWTLSVQDDFTGDTGTLMAWSVSCFEGIAQCADTSGDTGGGDCPDDSNGSDSSDDHDSDSGHGGHWWWSTVGNGLCAATSDTNSNSVNNFAATIGANSGADDNNTADGTAMAPRGLRGRTDRTGR